MYYIIDGYNLIFSLIESKQKLQTLREQVVLSLQKEFNRKKLSGMIVFDGAHRRGEESGLSYPSPLIVAYTPKGESADEYIEDKLRQKGRAEQMTVVTNDRRLQKEAKALGAKALENEAFLVWLHKRKKGTRREVKETPRNIERLEKIFEERLKEEL